MPDPTESIRREMVADINNRVESDDEQAERKRLEEAHGQVWDTQELQRDFEVHSFLAPFIFCTRKVDGKRGMMEFQHHPRFYFKFAPETVSSI